MCSCVSEYLEALKNEAKVPCKGFLPVYEIKPLQKRSQAKKILYSHVVFVSATVLILCLFP